MSQLPEDERALARATLLLLAASSRALIGNIRYRFDGIEADGFNEELLERLVKFPKPAHCVGALRGGALEITCKRAGPEVRWRDVKPLVDRIREESRGVQEEDAILLLRGGSDSMRIPLRLFRRWFAEYHLEDYSMSMEFNDKESLEQGAIAAVSIGLPPEMLRMEIR